MSQAVPPNILPRRGTLTSALLVPLLRPTGARLPEVRRLQQLVGSGP